MLHSKTQLETARLNNERRRNVELWKSSQRLSQIKKEIFEDGSVVVDPSNVQKILSQTQ